MDPLTLGLGGLGLITGLFGAGKQARDAKAQMMMRAAEQEAAPWTKQAPQTGPAFAPSGLGSALQGSLSGFQVGQSLESAGKQNEVNQALAAKLMGPPESAPFSDEEMKALEQVRKLKELNSSTSPQYGLGAAMLYGPKV